MNNEQKVANCRSNVYKFIGEAFEKMHDYSRMSTPQMVAEQLEEQIFKQYQAVANDIAAEKHISVEEALIVLRDFWKAEDRIEISGFNPLDTIK